MKMIELIQENIKWTVAILWVILTAISISLFKYTYKNYEEFKDKLDSDIKFTIISPNELFVIISILGWYITIPLIIYTIIEETIDSYKLKRIFKSLKKVNKSVREKAVKANDQETINAIDRMNEIMDKIK